MSLPTYEFTTEGLTRAMKALGDTTAKVHQSLFVLGVRGPRGCESNCPLAQYVHFVYPQVQQVYVYLDEDRNAFVVARAGHGKDAVWIESDDLPVHGEFVRNHDKGMYPDLIEEDADARVA